MNGRISGGRGTNSATAACDAFLEWLHAKPRFKTFKKVQAKVMQSSKRNLARCLKKGRAAATKVERAEVREMIVEEVSKEPRRAFAES